MYFLRIVLVLFYIPKLFAADVSSLRRVQASLKVGDYSTAIEEAYAILRNAPDVAESYEILITALARGTDHQRMLEIWDQFATRFPEKAYDQVLLETVCWGILRSGKESTTFSTRLLATIGAALTQDAYAVDFLLAGMRDSHTTVRMVAIELSALLGDRPLREEIVALLHRETKGEVRLAVMKAVAHLHATEALPDLLRCIEDRYASAEERALAIAAVLEMSETIDEAQFQRLVADPRAALRQLAVEIIAKKELRNQASLLEKLIQDPHADVAAAALRTIGLLRINRLGTRATSDVVFPLTTATEPEVGITASWVLLLHEEAQGQRAFKRWIKHERPEVRALAAAAIAAAGPHGVETARLFLKESTDPYVQINLVRVLVGQRMYCTQACEVLDRLLREHPERWMQGEGPFAPVLRSKLTHRPGIPNYPEVVNQTVRLEMLNILAILEHPQAGEAIRAFLAARPYGVTGLAAEVLLGEGDEMAIEHVRALLKDSDTHIRAEAALVLATWGHDPSALPVLLDLYPKADRMLKIKILEALSKISTRTTIPFLMERLHEPSLNIRLIAASVLIQALNH